MSAPARHVVILAHPAQDSFNAAIARTYAETVAAEGQEVVMRDLYALGFDPVLKDSERPGRPGFHLSDDVRDELALIRDADVFTIIYPIWFGMPPAILTGYVDRVLGAGVTSCEVQQRDGQGVMRGRWLLSITTSGARDVWLDEQGQIESLRTLMSRYLFNAFGMKRSEYLHIGGVVEGFNQRFVDQGLEDVRIRTRALCAALSREHAVPAA